jgi:hypothetical protein
MCSSKFASGMGFRDMELFNIAMLARQAWRILENPTTLSSGILKAVYFTKLGDLKPHRPRKYGEPLLRARCYAPGPYQTYMIWRRNGSME